MTYDEYVAKINGILAEPDTMLDKIGEVTDELKTDLAIIDSVKAENEGLHNRIRDLQDTNMKLYLKIGGNTGSADEDEKPSVEDMSYEEYVNYLKEGENNE